MAIKSDPRGLMPWFSLLSTAVKLFFILTLFLFPLGLVAVLASIDAARDSRSEREVYARVKAAQSASAVNALVERETRAFRLVAVAAAGGSKPCDVVRLARQSHGELFAGRYALFDGSGRGLCADPGFAASAIDRPLGVGETRVWLDRAGLRYGFRSERVYAFGVISPTMLRAVSAAPSQGRDIDVRIEERGMRLNLIDLYERGFLQRTLSHRTRLADSTAFAVVSLGAIPVSAVEILTIVLPLLMWLFAALTGWLVADRLLLRPIVKIRQAILAYQPGDGVMAVPETNTPATEIRDLAEAFARVTRTITAHEAAHEAAIARQARLVREVHHRVKNNLQVVASLLNLHARGARSSDAADAYASILRRVDALAVVHRNHFAELEDNRGVALRTLLSELTANLRATAPEGAATTPIALDLDAVHVNQDVAVSVAFFVTEVVEHAMMCAPDRAISISLQQNATPLSARLTMTSASLMAGVDCNAIDARQFERITTGLSRQLRATLDRDVEKGVFAMDIATQADG